jgi:transposase InsO family protein
LTRKLHRRAKSGPLLHADMPPKWVPFERRLTRKGLRHAYIKRGTPQLNGKVERSHRSDQQEFYQLLSYKGDVDLEAKLAEWENFYNFNRPHGAFNDKTPYEALRERL